MSVVCRQRRGDPLPGIRTVLRPSRALSLLGAITLLVLLAATAAGATSLGERKQALEQRLDEARHRAEEARAQERALGGEIAAQNEEIDAVRHQAADLEAELRTLEAELVLAEASLAALRAQLRDQDEQLGLLRDQLRTAQGRLADRAVEIYTSGEPDLVSIILAADSLGGLIDQIDLFNRTIEEDERLIADARELRAQVEQARARTQALERQAAEATAELADRTERRRAVYGELVTEQERLVALRAERERSLADVQVEREEWEAEAEALAADSARIDELLATAAASPPDSGRGPEGDVHSQTPAGGAVSAAGFVWPLQGTLTSPYGLRWGRLHPGIDIAAPSGSPIRAAASGTVVYAGWLGSYGLIVVIQHPNGLATAYAHDSSVNVSVGQTVSQGDVIASVGSTGRSTGPHVHFEIRTGGGPVDPLGYL